MREKRRGGAGGGCAASGESGAAVHWEPGFIVSPRGSPPSYAGPPDACYSINHTDVSQESGKPRKTTPLDNLLARVFVCVWDCKHLYKSVINTGQTIQDRLFKTVRGYSLNVKGSVHPNHKKIHCFTNLSSVLVTQISLFSGSVFTNTSVEKSGFTHKSLIQFSQMAERTALYLWMIFSAFKL